MWGPPGTFSPDCLESLTPETYASEGSLSSSVVLCRLDMEWGGGGGGGGGGGLGRVGGAAA